MKIGERIKKRRTELKMSADDLAKKLGKDRSTIYRYKKGEIGSIPVDVLVPIAKALDTTPQALIGWEDVSSLIHVDISEEGENKGALFTTNERTARHYEKWYRLTEGQEWTDRELDLLLECGRYLMSAKGNEEQEERLHFLYLFFAQINKT